MHFRHPIARFVVLAWAVVCSVSAPAAPDARPNILFIIMDDQRADLLGLAGHPAVKTPHIDRVGREGAWFRNFFAVTPLCSPSRASFLTGLYPHSHGVINNDKLGLDVISHTLFTWPRQLREAGYETAFIGKWHMGLDDSRRPGFDRWVSFKGQGVYIDGVVNEDGVSRQLTGYMHGRSFAPLLRNDAAPWRTAFLAEYFLEKVGLRVPTWQAVRTARWKYIRYPGETHKHDELYDLQADPREERNLIATDVARNEVPALRRELETLLQSTR